MGVEIAVKFNRLETSRLNEYRPVFQNGRLGDDHGDAQIGFR